MSDGNHKKKPDADTMAALLKAWADEPRSLVTGARAARAEIDEEPEATEPELEPLSSREIRREHERLDLKQKKARYAHERRRFQYDEVRWLDEFHQRLGRQAELARVEVESQLIDQTFAFQADTERLRARRQSSLVRTAVGAAVVGGVGYALMKWLTQKPAPVGGNR